MTTKTMHERCGDLFAAYHLAVDDGEMVLMTAEGGTPEFFILGYASGKDRYWLDPWQAGVSFDIDAETWDIPAWVTDAITQGVPLPRDGSLFGWKPGTDVTALIAIYTQYEPEHPVPNWMVMPFAGSPEKEWPPFTGAGLFGQWFWDHYQAARIVSLASAIAGTRKTVFWFTPEDAEAGCAAVAHDIHAQGYTLPCGFYVYSRELPHVELPAMDAVRLCATDLAPRFKRFAS
jgi:hypothetical protein